MKDIDVCPPGRGAPPAGAPEWAEEARDGAVAALVEALRSLSAAERRLVLLAYGGGDGPGERELSLKDLAPCVPSLRAKGGERLDEACRKLLRRVLILPSEDGGRIHATWFSSIRVLPGGKALCFRLQSAVEEGFRRLRGKDDALSFEALARLEGKYSHALFEALLAARPGNSNPRSWELESSLEGIRAMLGLDDRYEKAKALRKWVIDDAVADINLSDLGIRVEVETVLLGKKTKGFTFTVRQRKAK